MIDSMSAYLPLSLSCRKKLKNFEKRGKNGSGKSQLKLWPLDQSNLAVLLDKIIFGFDTDGILFKLLRNWTIYDFSRGPIRFFLNPEFFESLPIVYVSLPIATVVVVSPSCKFSPDTSIVCWLCILGTALCGLVWVLVWGCFSEAAEVAEVGRPPGQGEDMIFPTLSKFFTAPLFLALRPFFGPQKMVMASRKRICTQSRPYTN